MERWENKIIRKQKEKRKIVVPNSRIQEIYYARELAGARLAGREYKVGGIAEKPKFATGINPLLKAEDVIAVNLGKKSLEACLREELSRIVGNGSASKARISRELGPAFPSHGVTTRLIHPFVAEIDNPAAINLGPDLRVIPLEAAFEEMGRFDLVDMTLETSMLYYLMSRKIAVPSYLCGFDRVGFVNHLS